MNGKCERTAPHCGNKVIIGQSGTTQRALCETVDIPSLDCSTERAAVSARAVVVVHARVVSGVLLLSGTTAGVPPVNVALTLSTFYLQV